MWVQILALPFANYVTLEEQLMLRMVFISHGVVLGQY